MVPRASIPRRFQGGSSGWTDERREGPGLEAGSSALLTPVILLCCRVGPTRTSKVLPGENLAKFRIGGYSLATQNAPDDVHIATASAWKQLELSDRNFRAYPEVLSIGEKHHGDLVEFADPCRGGNGEA